MRYHLDPEKIRSTATRLKQRVKERFPESELFNISSDVSSVADQALEIANGILNPHFGIRVLKAVAIALLLGFVAFAVSNLKVTAEITNVGEFLQSLEAGINDLIFIGIAVYFLFNIEKHISRGRALSALNDLRVLAHVIDLNQLTKDPEKLRADSSNTASSPKVELSAFELSRYLDYCSELLSILSKIAALYAQKLNDSVALNAVDEVEGLTTGLSRKIWQKIMIINLQKA